jgi:hypothetical protein
MLGRRAISAVLLVLYLPACTFWQTTNTPLPEITGPPEPAASVRVTTVAGEEIELQDPRVHADTLIGGAVPDTGWVYLPLSDIERVEVKQRSLWKTLVGSVLLVGIALLALDNYVNGVE